MCHSLEASIYWTLIDKELFLLIKQTNETKN